MMLRLHALIRHRIPEPHGGLESLESVGTLETVVRRGETPWGLCDEGGEPGGEGGGGGWGGPGDWGEGGHEAGC